MICLGVSNGAVLSLLATAHDTDNLIDGIIAESPYISLQDGVKDIIELTIAGMPWWAKAFLLAPLVIRLVIMTLTFRIGGPPLSSSVLAVVNSIKKPVLLIHGTLDNRFRTDHSLRLFEALTEDTKELWFIEGGKHTEGFDASPLEYQKKVLNFAHRHFQQKATPLAMV